MRNVFQLLRKGQGEVKDEKDFDRDDPGGRQSGSGIGNGKEKGKGQN